MKLNLSLILYSLLVSIVVFAMINITHYSNDKYTMKGAIFALIFMVLVALMISMRDAYIVNALIFVTFLDVSIGKLGTTTTNIFILTAALVILIRMSLSHRSHEYYAIILKSGVTAPLLFIIFSYTISLFLVDKQWVIHLNMYHSIICTALFIWMIVCTIRNKQQLETVHKILLCVLGLNLIFSAIYLVFPQIDEIRAQKLSLFQLNSDEARLQGLSFRGEAYGEYLMICCIFIYTMFFGAKFQKGKLLLTLIAILSVIALILTKLRGASIVFFIGISIFMATQTLNLSKKILAFFSVLILFGGTQYYLQTYTNDTTLLDRFYLFSDRTKYVGYVPETRYFTWMPSYQFAKTHNFLGYGPSYAPLVDESDWKDLLADRASGNILKWPHNIVLIILCTVGIYGLMSYVLLVYRTIQLRNIYNELEPGLKRYYSSYLLCFTMFLIEAQKYDGALRYPGTSLYFIAILVALLFSCENMPTFGQTVKKM